MARSKKEISTTLQTVKESYEKIFGYPVRREILKTGIVNMLTKRETKFFQQRLEHFSDADLSELLAQLDSPYVEPIVKNDGYGIKNSQPIFAKKKS